MYPSSYAALIVTHVTGMATRATNARELARLRQANAALEADLERLEYAHKQVVARFEARKKRNRTYVPESGVSTRLQLPPKPRPTLKPGEGDNPLERLQSAMEQPVQGSMSVVPPRPKPTLKANTITVADVDERHADVLATYKQLGRHLRKFTLSAGRLIESNRRCRCCRELVEPGQQMWYTDWLANNGRYQKYRAGALHAKPEDCKAALARRDNVEKAS